MSYPNENARDTAFTWCNTYFPENSMDDKHNGCINGVYAGFTSQDHGSADKNAEFCTHRVLPRGGAPALSEDGRATLVAGCFEYYLNSKQV